jgi:hypothetical protein
LPVPVSMPWSSATFPCKHSLLGVAVIQFERLGVQTTVRSYIDSGITFTQIFNYTTPDKVTGCPPGFVSINAGHDDGNWQCLQLMVGSHLDSSADLHLCPIQHQNSFPRPRQHIPFLTALFVLVSFPEIAGSSVGNWRAAAKQCAPDPKHYLQVH